MTRVNAGSLSILFLCAFVVVYLLVQVEAEFSAFVISDKSIERLLFPLAIIAGLIGSVALSLALFRGVRIKRVVSVTGALIALSALALHQAVLLYDGLVAPRDPLHVQVQDVGNLLGPEAVIAGTYGPAFTIDNHLHNLIHPFSSKFYEKDLFSRFPVTHVAVAPSEMKIARQRYPELKLAKHVVQIWTRDGSFLIYRVPGADYRETDYERGMDFLSVAKLDSASVYFDAFLRKYPSSFLGRMVKARTLANQVRVEPAVTLLDELSQEFADYYFVHFLVGREYVTLYRLTRGSRYKERALAEYDRMQQLNPHIAPPRSDWP